jgi:hypothetical protein
MGQRALNRRLGRQITRLALGFLLVGACGSDPGASPTAPATPHPDAIVLCAAYASARSSMHTLEAMAATARLGDAQAAASLATIVQSSALAAQVDLVPVEPSEFEAAILTNLNWQFQTAQVVVANGGPGELPLDALAALDMSMAGSRQAADAMRAENTIADDGAILGTD